MEIRKKVDVAIGSSGTPQFFILKEPLNKSHEGR